MPPQKVSEAVTPANAGVHKWFIFLDSRVCGNDKNGSFLTFYETIKVDAPAKSKKFKICSNALKTNY